jgi:hypothetical protein
MGAAIADQPVRSLLVEPDHPVPQRLTVTPLRCATIRGTGPILFSLSIATGLR